MMPVVLYVDKLEPLITDVFNGGLTLAQVDPLEWSLRLTYHRIGIKLLEEQSQIMVWLSQKAQCLQHQLIPLDPEEKWLGTLRGALFGYRNTLMGEATDMLYRLGFAVSLHAPMETQRSAYEEHCYYSDDMAREVNDFLIGILQSGSPLCTNGALNGLLHAQATHRQGETAVEVVAPLLASTIENFVSTHEVDTVDSIIGMSDAAASYRAWIEAGQPSFGV